MLLFHQANFFWLASTWIVIHASCLFKHEWHFPWFCDQLVAFLDIFWIWEQHIPVKPISLAHEYQLHFFFLY
jgi:hypothetical protein